MIPVRVLGQVVVVVLVSLVVTVPALVGRERLARLPRAAPDRIRAVAPHLAALVALLVLNSVVRDFGPQLSWIVGWNVTGVIHGIEGTFVAQLQSALARPSLTAYFSVVYVYGYVFLLVFPLVAYLALSDREPFRLLALAYTYNYAFGLVLYVLFVAYGPRNLLPGAVESLLYTSWPESQLLTTQMNINTNVFPSLHTSLSTTVVLLASHTRRPYPAWFYLSTAIAASIVVGTLYLGIHWGTDALAGVVLAIASVVAARRYDPVRTITERLETDRAKKAIARVRESIAG